MKQRIETLNEVIQFISVMRADNIQRATDAAMTDPGETEATLKAFSDGMDVAYDDMIFDIRSLLRDAYETDEIPESVEGKDDL